MAKAPSQFRIFSHASLPFGLTSACYLFDQIADSLQLVMKHRGRGSLPTTTHYLDDFISISSSQHAASATFDIMESTAAETVLKYMTQSQNLSGLLGF